MGQECIDLMSMSVRDLKAVLASHNVDMTAMLEKSELVAALEHALANDTAAAASGERRARDNGSANATPQKRPRPADDGAEAAGTLPSYFAHGTADHSSGASGSVVESSKMADGENVTVQGSKSNTYVLKRRGDVYSCDCPAWRNQKANLTRTCKHLKEYLGQAFEARRLGGGDGGSGSPAKKSKGASTTDKDKARITKMVGLANTYHPSKDPKGWLMSEKLDGMRAVWDGTALYSRAGNPISMPASFAACLPPAFALDGELFLGRGRFQDVVSKCRTLNPSEASWAQLRYKVFEAPTVKKDCLSKRMEAAKQALAAHDHGGDIAFVELVEHTVCSGTEHMANELARVEAAGGEGAAGLDVCLRDVKDEYTRVHLLSAFLRAKDPIDKRERSELPQ